MYSSFFVKRFYFSVSNTSLILIKNLVYYCQQALVIITKCKMHQFLNQQYMIYAWQIIHSIISHIGSPAMLLKPFCTNFINQDYLNISINMWKKKEYIKLIISQPFKLRKMTLTYIKFTLQIRAMRSYMLILLG